MVCNCAVKRGLIKVQSRLSVSVVAILLVAGSPLLAAPTHEPTDLLPHPMLGSEPAIELPDPRPAPKPLPAKPPIMKPIVVPPPIVQPPAPPPIIVAVAPVTWSAADATQLLSVIDGIGTRGLISADYEADALRAALIAGEGAPLNEIASRAFVKLAVDLRDGRTPYKSRVQWFIRDPDADAMPSASLLQQAVSNHDVEATLTSVEPTHPDYAALKVALAKTPATDSARLAVIRTNLDRWRWLPRDLGARYVAVNVPEYMVRVVNNGRNIESYRAIVGKPTSATPQLAEVATGIIFHPTWTIPQSIIKESVGAMVASRPAVAKARGYRWTGSGASLSVVQAPGPGNSLGVMKVDMPNPHAIFLHDTPARGLFERPDRALSHGCIRTDRAMEFGILMAILQAGTDSKQAAEIIKAGENTRIPFTTPIPVYIAYFTLASGGDGKLAPFADIYGRDTAVVASFAKPRAEKILVAPQPIIANDAPGT